GTALGAPFPGPSAALGPAVDPRPTHAAAREPVVQAAWLPPAQDGRVLPLKLMIGGERRRIGRASDQLDAPGIERLHDGGGRARDKAGDLLTGHGGGGGDLGSARPRGGPLARGVAPGEPPPRLGASPP